MTTEITTVASRRERPPVDSEELNVGQMIRLVRYQGWAFAGIGAFAPEWDPTVDALGVEGLELRVAYFGGGLGFPPSEVTDTVVGTTLWMRGGIPEVRAAKRLMEELKDILVESAQGVGHVTLDLDTGEIIRERVSR